MGHCVDCFIQVIECEGPRPSCSIDACMCSVDGHGYNIGTCFGLHYKAVYMSSIARPLGQSVQVNISDVIQQSRRSILVSFPWFLRKYHRTKCPESHKRTIIIIIRCSVWDELRMFRPIRWIKNTVAEVLEKEVTQERMV